MTPVTPSGALIEEHPTVIELERLSDNDLWALGIRQRAALLATQNEMKRREIGKSGQSWLISQVNETVTP